MRLSKKAPLKSTKPKANLSLGRNADPNLNRKLKSLQIEKMTSKLLRLRTSKKRRTSQPTQNPKSQLIIMKSRLLRKIRLVRKKLSRRASLKLVKLRKSQRTSFTMAGKPSVSDLIYRTIVTKQGISTNHSEDTGETQGTNEEDTMEVAVLITIRLITASNLTTKAIGCTTETLTQDAISTAATIDISDRASIRVKERSEHLVSLLSPQVMVDQAKEPTMSSFMTGKSNKDVNFQPGQLKESILRSD